MIQPIPGETFRAFNRRRTTTERPFPASIVREPGESTEHLLRRFKKKTEFVLKDYARHCYAETRSQRRRRKRNAAIRRVQCNGS